MDQFVAQLERQPDGGLVAVLYVNGGRADTRPVGSVRQGKRRAHDLLCAAVDAQVKGLAAVDRVRRTAHVELVPWSRARRAATEPARMGAYPTR
jgi:hypothetical protein